MPPPARESVVKPSSVFHRVLLFDELPSTNDYAVSIVNEPDAVGTVIRAHSQTAGRGTMGRSWHSPLNVGVWLSVILDPPPAIRRPVILTAWAAISVAEAIQALSKSQPRVKWPNDVMIENKKVCGILIEQGPRTIVGIGLNVNQSPDDFASAGLPEATSLAMVAGHSFEVDSVAADLIAALDREYELSLTAELKLLESRWTSRVGLVGRAVEVERHDGQRLQGVLQEMTFDGLILIAQNGEQLRRIPEEIRHMSGRDFAE